MPRRLTPKRLQTWDLDTAICSGSGALGLQSDRRVVEKIESTLSHVKDPLGSNSLNRVTSSLVTG